MLLFCEYFWSLSVAVIEAEWLARPPLSLSPYTAPPNLIRILHTKGVNCSDYQTCANKILGIQGEHVANQGMPDIGYNFMIGGDGNVYFGRGDGVQNDWSPESLDIAYVGNYLAPYDKMTDKMDRAGRKLIQRLVEKKKIADNYVVVAQNQTEKTTSPGENVFKRIVFWPRYDNETYFKQ